MSVFSNVGAGRTPKLQPVEPSSPLLDALAHTRDEMIRRPWRALIYAALAWALGWALPISVIASLVLLGSALQGTANVFGANVLALEIAMLAALVALVIYRDLRKAAARRRATE
jgi:hypothetical protein